jgi:GGDEF domain-containing protein
VEEVARRLDHCFDAPFEVDGKRLSGSASFGVSICPRDGMSKNSLLKAADVAMYASKAVRGASGRRASQKV